MSISDVSQVLEAVERGEPLYLSDHEWMTIPWESQPRTTFDRIIDICTLSPAIVSKARNLGDVAHDQMLPWLISIVSDIAGLIAKFDVFYAGFENSHGATPMFWTQRELQSGVLIDDQTMIASVLDFQPTLCFESLDTASIMFMYCMYYQHRHSSMTDVCKGHRKLVFG